MADNTDAIAADAIAADAVDLELEAMRIYDYSWHPCQVYFSPSGAGLVIKYENNNSEDILESEKEAMIRIRARSLPLQDDDCTHIKPGDHVVVSQKSQSENGFFDAEVEKVLRVRHSKRGNCRCSFMIKWLQQDLNGESLKVPSSSVMRLANESITNHPTISAFIDAAELNNSSFSCLSPPLNTVVSDFDMDLHVMLEKQIEGIKNSVHGSKKRIRDEILGLEVNTHEQVKETDVSMSNVKEPEIQVPDNRSPLNPLAARAALASLMSTGINDISKITEMPLGTKVTPKQERTFKKSLFSKSKPSDNIKEESNDISTNDGQQQDKMNPKSETRWSRAKIQKVKSVPVDDNESSKKPSPVTNRRFTRSVLNHEAANMETEVTKESSVDELPTQQSNKKRNNSGVACATQDSGGNVTSNGGRSCGSKKKSLDLDKQKIRSSPRFISKN